MQTAKATEEIGAQIQAIQASSTATLNASRSVHQVVGELKEKAGMVAVAVEQQDGAVREIADSMLSLMGDAADGSAAAGDAEKALRGAMNVAAEVDTLAGVLDTGAKHLDSTVREFIGTVKAA